MASTHDQPDVPEDSLVRLTLTPRFGDRSYKQGGDKDQEIVWSPTFARHACYHLGVEVVTQVHKPRQDRDGGAFLIIFLKSSLDPMNISLPTNHYAQHLCVNRIYELPGGSSETTVLAARRHLSLNAESHKPTVDGWSDSRVCNSPPRCTCWRPS